MLFQVHHAGLQDGRHVRQLLEGGAILRREIDRRRKAHGGQPQLLAIRPVGGQGRDLHDGFGTFEVGIEMAPADRPFGIDARDFRFEVDRIERLAKAAPVI